MSHCTIIGNKILKVAFTPHFVVYVKIKNYVTLKLFKVNCIMIPLQVIKIH